LMLNLKEIISLCFLSAQPFYIAHNIMDEPKTSGFFFNAAIVALPPIVTPIELPMQEIASIKAMPI
jgi:hypothetical protein